MEVFNADRMVMMNIDVQNDFCPGGALAVAEGDQVIAPLNELNAYTRAQNGTVIFTGDQHPETTPHFDIWPVHCVSGTEGAALRDDLEVLPTDIIVDKGTGQTDGYSAFEGRTSDGRELAELVRPINRERVAIVLGGLATDYCVLNSALDAARVDPANGEIRVFVVEAAVRGVNIQPNDSEEALAKMQAAGVTLIKNVRDITEGSAIALAA